MSAPEKVVIGDSELWCGDCRDVLPGLEKVDAAITDPPYGIGLKKKTNDFRGANFDNGESAQSSVLYEDSPEYVIELINHVIPMILCKAERALIFSGQAMLWHYPEPSAIGCVYLPNGAGRCAWGFQCMQPILFYG